MGPTKAQNQVRNDLNSQKTSIDQTIDAAPKPDKAEAQVSGDDTAKGKVSIYARWSGEVDDLETKADERQTERRRVYSAKSSQGGDCYCEPSIFAATYDSCKLTTMCSGMNPRSSTTRPKKATMMRTRKPQTRATKRNLVQSSVSTWSRTLFC